MLRPSLRAAIPLAALLLLALSAPRGAHADGAAERVAPTTAPARPPTRPTPAPEAAPGWLVPTLHSAGFISTMYLCSVAIWPQSFAVAETGDNWARFREGFRSPPEWRRTAGPFEWDGDPWLINVIGHGLFGSEFYLRHRQYRRPPWVAALMTVAWSVAWEYLVESWHKHPSGIDLAWTPTAGSLLGETRFQLYRRVRRMPRSVGRHVLFYLLDPFGQIERDLLRLAE